MFREPAPVDPTFPTLVRRLASYPPVANDGMVSEPCFICAGEGCRACNSKGRVWVEHIELAS